MAEKKMTLADRARALKEFSPLMKGREKLDTKDVLNQELTIENFDIVQKLSESSPFAVVVFKEHPDEFIFAGSVLTSMLAELTAILHQEGEDIHEALKSEPIRIRMSTRRSNTSKRDYTDVEVL